MNRLAVVVSLLVLAALACTFSTNPDRSDGEDMTPVPTQIGAAPTSTPFATQTPAPTSTPQPTSAPAATATSFVVVDPCTPRTD